MFCISCNSLNIVEVQARASGRCSMLHSNIEIDTDGYVTEGMYIGAGDYIEFGYCLSCGQLQNDFPLKLTEVRGK